MVQNEDDSFGYTVKVTSADPYDGFFETTRNDIIILKLDDPLEFSKDVQKICLPTHDGESLSMNKSKDPKELYYSGWNFRKTNDRILR